MRPLFLKRHPGGTPHWPQRGLPWSRGWLGSSFGFRTQRKPPPWFFSSKNGMFWGLSANCLLLNFLRNLDWDKRCYLNHRYFSVLFPLLPRIRPSSSFLDYRCFLSGHPSILRPLLPLSGSFSTLYPKGDSKNMNLMLISWFSHSHVYNSFLGCLAASVSRVCDTWSKGHVGHRDYFKNKKTKTKKLFPAFPLPSAIRSNLIRAERANKIWFELPSLVWFSFHSLILHFCTWCSNKRKVLAGFISTPVVSWLCAF